MIFAINQIKVGDKAPDFILPDEKNRARSLKEFLGQKGMLVILVGTLTSKCTKEHCDLRDYVRIVAPVDIRVKRIMKNEGLSQKDADGFPFDDGAN